MPSRLSISRSFVIWHSLNKCRTDAPDSWRKRYYPSLRKPYANAAFDCLIGIDTRTITI